MLDDARIEALYAAPLDRFVAERDSYAADLKAAGDPEAAAVKRLPKPSVPAWAVNQLARAEPDLMRGLAEIGERLRAAHAAVLAGGDPERLRAARDDERAAIAGLVRRAEEVLAEAGFAPSTARTERVADTLGAMAADASMAETVRAGRLTTELQRVGFGDTVEPAALHTVRASAPEPAAAPDQAAGRASARAAADAAMADALRSREEAVRAEAEAAGAEEVARRARETANRARRDAERAERAAEEAARRSAELGES